MNMYTRDIMALLDLPAETALAVQARMEINGIDYSECSTTTFNKEAKSAWKELVNELPKK
jgi:hypothetical protein